MTHDQLRRFGGAVGGIIDDQGRHKAHGFHYPAVRIVEGTCGGAD
ncbi:MAG: hypothetical protein R3C68_08870 [Myxococcota bacterium]